MRLVVDPGHPSHSGDKGCVAPGLVEHEYTWELACALRVYLHHCAPGVEVVLSREAVDEVVSLEERGRRSREANADLVLSLHVDATESPHARRAAAYYWPGNETGAQIAETIVRSMPHPLHRSHGHGVFATRHGRGADKWLADARAVIAPHPATTVLVEVGYSSNPIDLAALLDNTTQVGIVLALMTGVVRAQQLGVGNAKTRLEDY